MQDTTDPNLARGADNLVVHCLRARAREAVALLVWNADDVAGAVEQAVVRTGAQPRRFDLAGLANEAERGATRGQLVSLLNNAFTGATASVLVAGTGMPTTLSIAIIEAARIAKTRHLHAVGIEPRVLAQSLRAEPEKLAQMNERLSAILKSPARVRATSDAGTSLEVGLAPQYPLLSASGQPAQGESDNLPSGFVYTYPSQANGVFVADRGVFGSGVPRASAQVRRTPVTVTIELGRVTKVECAHEPLREQVEKYLRSHAEAGRVGIVIFPTNYLVRSEIGVEIQDELAPGMNVCLGFTESGVTRAPYDAPVQLRLLGRKISLEVRGQKVVSSGRFDDALVAGIDPFR